MKLSKYSILIVLVVLISSCKNQTNKTTKEPSDKETIHSEANQNKAVGTLQIESTAIKKSLQGEWKEAEYPFRTVIFKDETVKFIEEGMVESPRFKTYKILNECPFDTNNMQNSTTQDTILVLVEDKRCELLNISNNTFTLSGYNTVTNDDYKIVYKKVK